MTTAWIKLDVSSLLSDYGECVRVYDQSDSIAERVDAMYDIAKEFGYDLSSLYYGPDMFEISEEMLDKNALWEDYSQLESYMRELCPPGYEVEPFQDGDSVIYFKPYPLSDFEEELVTAEVSKGTGDTLEIIQNMYNFLIDYGEAPYLDDDPNLVSPKTKEEEEGWFYNLFSQLDMMAPAGYHFGYSEGNSSLLGFFENTEAIVEVPSSRFWYLKETEGSDKVMAMSFEDAETALNAAAEFVSEMSFFETLKSIKLSAKHDDSYFLSILYTTEEK